MKKTAVLIYNSFCNFEFSVALEILALAEKEVVIFAHTKEAVKSEDGLMVLPNQTISEINIDEYDSLILPGAMDIREAIENEEVIEFFTLYLLIEFGLNWMRNRLKGFIMLMKSLINLKTLKKWRKKDD